MNNKSYWLYEWRQLRTWWSLLLLAEIALIAIMIGFRDGDLSPPLTAYMHEIGAVPFAILVFILLTYKESTLPMMEMRATWPVSLGKKYMRKIAVVLVMVMFYQASWYMIYENKYDQVTIKVFKDFEHGFVYDMASLWSVVWTSWSSVIFYIGLILFFMAWTRQSYLGWLAAFAWWMLELLSTGSILGEWSSMMFTWEQVNSGLSNRYVYFGLTAALFVGGIMLLEKRVRWSNSVGDDTG